MPGGTILNITDPYEYQVAVSRAEDLSIVVTAPGRFQSELTLVDLHHLGVDQGRILLPRIVRGAPKKNLCRFHFYPPDNQAHIAINGIETPESCIAFACPGAEFVLNHSGECYWAGVTLPLEALASTSRALAGYEITVPKAMRLTRPPPLLMARLGNLHRAATHLAATAPDILSHPEVARAVEQELLRALIACLADSEAIKDPNPNRQRIMQQFHRVIEANRDEPLYVAEVCAAIHVSDRTLRQVCSDFLGMSPHRYLWLRRMDLARRALIVADQSARNVTEIANDYGFGELGRFAVAYRQLFGEPPSATLRRAP